MDRHSVAPVTRVLVLLLFALGSFATGVPAAADDAPAGKKAYEMNCSSCHGLTGKGDGPVAVALKPPPRDFSTGEFKFDANKNGTVGDDEDLKLVVQKGAMTYGGSVLMAAWPSLSDEQVDQIVSYIRSLKE